MAFVAEPGNLAGKAAAGFWQVHLMADSAVIILCRGVQVPVGEKPLVTVLGY
jgi:hypothetical protein